MTKKEAYQVLGLPPGTKLPEIKKKYRKLMIQMHPDAGIHEKENYTYNVQEINAAYSILKEKATSGIRSDGFRNQSNCHSQNKYTKKNLALPGMRQSILMLIKKETFCNMSKIMTVLF